MRPKHLLAAALGLLSQASSPIHAVAQPPPRAPAPSRMEALRAEGSQLCAQGHHAAGIRALREVHRAEQDPAVAGELGACELQAGRHRDAAEHLAAALRAPAEGQPADARAGWSAALEQARAKVGRVTITVDQPGADVIAGGRFAGLSPLPAEVFVDPGDVTIVAKKPGGGEAAATVRVAAGGAERVALSLGAPAGAAGDALTPTEQRLLWPAFVLGGAGLAAGAIGVGLFVVGSGKGSDADAQLAALETAHGPVPCRPEAPAEGCSAIKDLRGERDSMLDIGAGFVIAGGASLAGALLYTLWATAPAPIEGKPGVSLAPSVAPDGAGLWMRGAF